MEAEAGSFDSKDATFSYKSSDSTSLWGPFCVDCMNQWYSTGHISQDMTFLLHQQKVDIPYTLDELLQLNGRMHPFTLQAVEVKVRTQPCSHEKCSHYQKMENPTTSFDCVDDSDVPPLPSCSEQDSDVSPSGSFQSIPSTQQSSQSSKSSFLKIPFLSTRKNCTHPMTRVDALERLKVLRRWFYSDSMKERLNNLHIHSGNFCIDCPHCLTKVEGPFSNALDHVMSDEHLNKAITSGYPFCKEEDLVSLMLYMLKARNLCVEKILIHEVDRLFVLFEDNQYRHVNLNIINIKQYLGETKEASMDGQRKDKCTNKESFSGHTEESHNPQSIPLHDSKTLEESIPVLGQSDRIGYLAAASGPEQIVTSPELHSDCFTQNEKLKNTLDQIFEAEGPVHNEIRREENFHYPVGEEPPPFVPLDISSSEDCSLEAPTFSGNMPSLPSHSQLSNEQKNAKSVEFGFSCTMPAKEQELNPIQDVKEKEKCSEKTINVEPQATLLESVPSLPCHGALLEEKENVDPMKFEFDRANKLQEEEPKPSFQHNEYIPDEKDTMGSTECAFGSTTPSQEQKHKQKEDHSEEEKNMEIKPSSSTIVMIESTFNRLESNAYEENDPLLNPVVFFNARAQEDTMSTTEILKETEQRKSSIQGTVKASSVQSCYSVLNDGRIHAEEIVEYPPTPRVPKQKIMPPLSPENKCDIVDEATIVSHMNLSSESNWGILSEEDVAKLSDKVYKNMKLGRSCYKSTYDKIKTICVATCYVCGFKSGCCCEYALHLFTPEHYEILNTNKIAVSRTSFNFWLQHLLELRAHSSRPYHGYLELPDEDSHFAVDLLYRTERLIPPLSGIIWKLPVPCELLSSSETLSFMNTNSTLKDLPIEVHYLKQIAEAISLYYYQTCFNPKDSTGCPYIRHYCPQDCGVCGYRSSCACTYIFHLFKPNHINALIALGMKVTLGDIRFWLNHLASFSKINVNYQMRPILEPLATTSFYVPPSQYHLHTISRSSFVQYNGNRVVDKNCLVS